MSRECIFLKSRRKGKKKFSTLTCLLRKWYWQESSQNVFQLSITPVTTACHVFLEYLFSDVNRSGEYVVNPCGNQPESLRRNPNEKSDESIEIHGNDFQNITGNPPSRRIISNKFRLKNKYMKASWAIISIVLK